MLHSLSTLDAQQLSLCESTISSNTFYYIVGHHLSSKSGLSVVRMGDGEKSILADANKKNPSMTVNTFNEKWLINMGCLGISFGEIKSRIIRAGNECDWFAPSISGISDSRFNLYDYFKKRDTYVDNFFVNQWTSEMIANLYDIAGDVLLIHRNVAFADMFQKRLPYTKLQFLKLSSWEETEGVIEAAKKKSSQLVLFSAGCAGKYISNAIAQSGKVVLDLGNSAERWLPVK